MIVALIVVGWIVCGVVAWGGALGQCDNDNKGCNKVFDYERFTSRGDYGFASFVFFAGPIGLFAIVLISSFFQHGFKWK